MRIQLASLKSKWKGIKPEEIIDEVKASEYKRDKALATQLTENMGQLTILNDQVDRAKLVGSGLSIEDITSIAGKNAAFQSMTGKLTQSSSMDPFSEDSSEESSPVDSTDPYKLGADLTNLKNIKSKASSDAMAKTDAGSVGVMDLIQKGGENLYGNVGDLFDIFSEKVKKGKKYILEKARTSSEKARAAIELEGGSPKDFRQ
jgi:hypothetical protein